MNLNERLAALTALKNVVYDELEDTRLEADEALLAENAERGVDKLALTLGGERVGEFTVTYDKPGFRVTDAEALAASDPGRVTWRRSIRPEMIDSVICILRDFDPLIAEEAVEQTAVPVEGWDVGLEYRDGFVVDQDGAVVDGVERVRGDVRGTRVTGCKPEDVIPKIAQIGGADALLLEERR